MRPIALFYHVYMGGGVIPANSDNCFRIVTDQVTVLKQAGLSDAAARIVIGVSGTPSDYIAVASVAPPTSDVVHNLFGSGELPTMKLMQNHCFSHPDHLICYIHTKGAIHNGNPTYEAWRRCMERAVIWNWRKCVADLERGYDTVGAHWLTPARFSFIGAVPYWGGNFFWAQAKFLNELPPIDVNADRYQAEVWIGKSKRKPNVVDYARHFPMSGCPP